MSQIKWLHISDVHFKGSQPYGQDVVTNALLTSLPTLMRRHGELDAIFVTGDIADVGASSEYVQATTFFDSLLEITKLGKERLYVVPGNHDVSRMSEKGLIRTLNSEQNSASYFEPSEGLPHLVQRKENFLSWFDSYFQGIREFPKKSIVLET